MKEPAAESVFTFRWKYVMLPLVILLLSVILGALFYARLPAEVAYHFQSDGSPDRWFAPSWLMLWALAPQFLLTLGAVTVSWVISRLASRFLDPKSAVISPQRIMLLTGNMVALAQIILLFALLDIFSYNSYQTHLRPSVLVFALIVMVIGGIILGSFFVQMMKRVWIANKK